MRGRTIQAKCEHGLGRREEPSRPIVAQVEPGEPMTGKGFVAAHPDLARALAQLAVHVEERPDDRD